MAQYVAAIIGNGVYDGELAATADGSAMSVTLPSGRAWINGYHYRNDDNLTLAIDNADGVLNRIDIIVLRWDINERSITAQVVKGTPASTAMVPAITRTAEQYDLKLAEISVPAGTTAIIQSLITDTRLDNGVCGIVTGVVKQVDTTTLYAQIQSDLAHFKSGSETDFTSWSADQRASFDTWLAGIKDALDGDTAGNLLNLITTHTSNSDIHVTAAQKTAWTAKAEKSDIPTSLPANGGHAATADSATTSANTTSIAGALTLSTAEPTSTLPAGTLWGVYS